METSRIVLRPWRESDAEVLYRWASDPDVGPRAGWPPHKSVEESLEIIRTIFHSDHMWAIELKETGEPIGCIGYMVRGESNIGIGENDAEVGGTIGDIESAPFMEAIRQLRWQLGRDAVCVHLTYVPYLKAADELKTKPTQHSVKELQGMGIQPDILVLRTERHLDDHLRMKVASFCNVDLECVVQSEDMPSIYEVPVNMQRQGLDAAILRKIGIPVGETPAMKSWHDFLDKQRNAKREVQIGLVGKYDLQDAFKSIRESLNLAAIYNDAKVRIHFINSEEITQANVAEKLAGLAGIVICPSFGQRGIEGKIIAAEYTRTHDIPTFGICLVFGCGIAGFIPMEIAPLFEDAIDVENIILPKEFVSFIQ